MKSPTLFIITPEGGNRYSATKKIAGVEIIMSVSQEDHRYTNRIADVISVPAIYDGVIEAGDKVVVHHNTFRVGYDMQGREKRSSSHLFDNTYGVNEEQIYMYKRGEGGWISLDPYCFIAPIERKEGIIFSNSKHEKLHGVIAIPGASTKLGKGTEVVFKPHSEYEFKIDDQLLYRVNNERICMTITN